MTAPPSDLSVAALLLDIEGTTTPLQFVYEVLFPYARAHAKSFLERHASSPDVIALTAHLRDENAQDLQQSLNPPSLQDTAPEAQIESLVDYLHWLMDRDRKTSPLKSLQGMIWEDGYQTGELKSLVFDDVPTAFERWQSQQREIVIFSSGSVLAQKLLFAHTGAGDLTSFIRAYFDTAIGAKGEPRSYERIASESSLVTSQILFLSDVTAELDAASLAGMQTLLSVRPGNRPQPSSSIHHIVRTFDEVFP